jgi:hypothetical protein
MGQFWAAAKDLLGYRRIIEAWGTRMIALSYWSSR